jgi:hypothetical protein
VSIALAAALAVIVAFVAIDTFARREPRGPRPPRGSIDEALVTTDKIIVVDLRKRR